MALGRYSLLVYNDIRVIDLSVLRITSIAIRWTKWANVVTFTIFDVEMTKRYKSIDSQNPGHGSIAGYSPGVFQAHAVGNYLSGQKPLEW